MRITIAFLIAALVGLAGAKPAGAQSLLDRLERTLTQPAQPESLPAPNAGASENPRLAPPPTRPLAGRPTLGVTVEPVTDAVARQRGLAVRRGALITAIVQGAPADRAGLPLGGVIVAVDGTRIDSSKELVEAIRAARIDRPIEISYYEGTRLYRKRVHLVPSVGDPILPAPDVAADGSGALAPPRTDRRFAPRDRNLNPLGDRPLLGRVGQIIDGLVAPAAGAAPVPLPAADDGEVAVLREQVATLQQQLAALQQRLAEVEKQLAAKPSAN